MRTITYSVALHVLLSGSALAIDYTWTANAGDGNWTNTVNWDANGVPVDNYTSGDSSAGLSMHHTNTIVFDGDSLPTTNFPGIGGYWPNDRDTPTMLFNSGGTADYAVVAGFDGLWTHSSTYRTVLTVGDGIGGGVEDVALNITGLTGPIKRHANGTHNILVHSDGTLNFGAGIDLSYNEVRWTTFTIAGGRVVVSGAVNDLDNYASNVVAFTEAGGSFTAAYGGDYAGFPAVVARLGADFVNNTGTGSVLKTSRDASTFTVSEGYCWTGAAGDGDWSNTVNWAHGAVPVDTQPGTGDRRGVTLLYANVIEFDGTNLPAVNIPGLGGFHDSSQTKDWDTPGMVLKSGGTMTMAVVGREGGLWTNPNNQPRTVFTIGDGVGRGHEDVTLNLTMGAHLMRHGGGHHNFVVNSDGTFNITAGVPLQFSYKDLAARTSSFTIAGGTVVVNDPVLYLNTQAGCYVEFTEPGGSFTAKYGGDFTDVALVRSSLDVDFRNSMGIPGSYLHVIDRGNSFTVVAHEYAATLLWVR